MDRAVMGFVESLQATEDVDQIFSLVGQTLRSWGFSQYTYLVIRGLGETDFWHTDYPQDWIEHYETADYCNVDPIHSLAQTTNLPFRWNESTARLPRSHKAPILEAGEFGLTNGITVPLRGPGQCSATFNVTVRLPDREAEALWRERRFDLHLAALHTHEAIIEKVYSKPEDRYVILYPRERECLLWSSRGKTAWEIGSILGLSAQTVTTYLKSACQKLGVFSKTQAVVKAILLGLIIP